MNFLACAFFFLLLLVLPANAQDVGIQFGKMKVGTTLVTQNLSGKKLVRSEKYLGRRGDFFVTEKSWVNADGTTKRIGNSFYDAKGRLIKTEHKTGQSTYTPFSCMFAVGACKHTHDYPNPFSKKTVKRTKSVSRYDNRLEGNTFIVTWKMADGSTAEVPFQLGPYNFRVSSKYKNALGQLRGHTLIKIIEPGASQSPLVAKQSKSAAAVSEPDDCKALYATLKAKAPGDVSICEAVVKAPKFRDCKAPEKHIARRPAAHVVVVLDASGSMAGKLGGKTKMALAKHETNRFLSALEKDVPVGLLVYGHKGNNQDSGKAESCAAIEWVQKVSPVRGRVKGKIKALKPKGWTPLAGSMDYLREELPKVRKRSKDEGSISVVYVISDGKETCGGDPVASAKALHDSGVRAVVNVIGFDVDDETRSQLEAISNAGGGKYFPAKDSAALRKQLDAARQTEASLLRYKYCANQNIGTAAMVYHNAKIETTSCYHRESKKKRWNLISQWIKEFDTDEEKACAAKVKSMAHQDYVEDGKWLVQASKRLQAAGEAAVNEARTRWNIEALEPAN